MVLWTICRFLGRRAFCCRRALLHRLSPCYSTTPPYGFCARFPIYSFSHLPGRFLHNCQPKTYYGCQFLSCWWHLLIGAPRAYTSYQLTTWTCHCGHCFQAFCVHHGSFHCTHFHDIYPLLSLSLSHPFHFLFMGDIGIA